ncbi:MAG: metal ABC transporter permease, partial [Planctomycetota bacterium]
MAGWLPLDTWIVVIGVLTAVACGVLGVYLVLRRESMMGDAISHAVLPGLAVAFLVSASRDATSMFVGAAVVGVLTAVLTQAIHRWARVDVNASMGVVFTTLFAVGLVLIVRAADSVDLDPGCVLYGAIEYAPLHTVSVGGVAVPRAAAVMGGMLAVNLVFVALFWKELRITCFDPALAGTLGLRPAVTHYALMVLVAATTVAAFEAVGSILVVAMLIVPAATAHLLTDRLSRLLPLSGLVAAVGAAAGHVAAITVPPWFGYADTSSAGMMVVATGAIFGVVLLAAPRYGVVSRGLARAALARRILREDVLGLLYRVEEMPASDRPAVAPALVASALDVGGRRARAALRRLGRAGRIRPA